MHLCNSPSEIHLQELALNGTGLAHHRSQTLSMLRRGSDGPENQFSPSLPHVAAFAADSWPTLGLANLSSDGLQGSARGM